MVAPPGYSHRISILAFPEPNAAKMAGAQTASRSRNWVRTAAVATSSSAPSGLFDGGPIVSRFAPGNPLLVPHQATFARWREQPAVGACVGCADAGLCLAVSFSRRRTRCLLGRA